MISFGGKEGLQYSGTEKKLPGENAAEINMRPLDRGKYENLKKEVGKLCCNYYGMQREGLKIREKGREK